MKRLPFLRALLTLLLGFMAFTTATAQTATDPNAGARLTLGSTPGSGDFSWWGQPGRTYFLQRSVDLSAWEYLPLIYSGTDARLAWDFPSAESQLFLRLRSTDLPTNDPYTADFDGDQIGNWDELLQGTDPLAAADTDANGLPDDWEKFYFGQTGVDPNAAVPGGGGLTNLQHFQLGSNPNLPPPLDPLLQAPPPVTITASPATLGQSAATLLYPADDSQLLLQNGNFSAPALPTPDRWSTFGVRTGYPNGGIPGWTALSGSLIELQQIAVNPAAGAGQYCELDAHWPTSLHLGPSDHGIQQTVNLARGRYLLFFDYRGRATNARSFTVKASSGPGMIFGLPNPSLKLLASTTTASTNTWQRASVSFAVAGGDPAAAQLPITLLFDIADAADSFGAYIDNVILLPLEVVELSPKLRDADNNEIAGSEKPAVAPNSTEMVERDPSATPTPLNDASAIRIAWRDMKVKIGAPLAGKKVTWSMTPQFTPLQSDGTPEAAPRFRGKWGTAANSVHRNRFSASEKYGVNGYESMTQMLESDTNVGVTTMAKTTVDAAGYTAIRVNLPPIGFNKARIKIVIEDTEDVIDLIDFEVPAVIVIDPGHGGPDSGNSLETVTPKLYERDLTLLYSTELKTTLQTKIRDQGRCCKVLVGKQSNNDGTKYPNGLRALQARDQGADINLALHFNGGPQSASGTQVYVIREDQGNVNHAQDLALATRMYAAGEAAFRIGNRSAEQRIIDLAPGADGHVFLRDNLLNNVAGTGKESTFIRATLLELEYLTAAGAADKLTGPNATTTRQNYGIQAAQAVVNDLLIQP